MVPLSLKFMGIKVSRLNREELKEHLIQTLYDKDKFRVMVLDEKKLFHAMVDAEFRAIVNSCEVVLCGSGTVAWAARVLTGERLPVIMPVTLFLDFMRVSDEMGYTFYLYGAHKSANLESAKQVRKSFPHARLVGAYHSYINGKELEDVLIAIRKSSPQIFFGNLKGGSAQEKWLESHKDSFSGSILVGVDHAFEVVSGKKKMPPMAVQKKGWNGLYQSLTQPWNLPRFFRITCIFMVVLYRKVFKKEKSF